MEKDHKKYSCTGIWVSLFDGRGQVMFWSEEAEKISGYSQDKLHGNDRVWQLLFPDGDYRQQIREAVCSPGRKADSSMEVSITGRSGQPVRLIWNILDLSGLKQDEVTLVVGKLAPGEQEQLQGLGAVFADSLPQVAYIKDRDGRFVYANDSLCRLLGLERGQILGKKNSQLWPNPVASMLGKNDRQVMAQKKLHSFQETVGENQTFLSFKFPLKGSGRDLLGAISIDISERIEEEESLKRSRQRYEQTLSLLPDVVLETDRQGKITFLNQAAKKILGLNQAHLESGVHALDMVAEKDRLRVESTFLKILKKPGRQSRLLEFTAHGRHGNIALAGHIAPITYNRDRAEGVRGVMVDITRLKKKEKALADSEKRYRRLFDNLRDGIYVSTLEGKYVDVNPALVSMLGYSSREELLSKDIKKDIYADGSKRPMPTQRAQPFETQLKKADGSKIWVEISCQVIEQDGKPAYYEGIVRDISVRKEYEQKLRYKSFHDSLTGLYNRAYFEEELKRLDRKRQLPLSIIIGDVNSLKLINDAFGHQQGDQLLKKAAEILRKACRKEDIIARWGGDEFAILLPRTPQQVAAKVVARTRDIAGGYSIADVPVSISLGKCTKSDHSQDIQKVIEEAEDSMYHHKLVEKKRLSGEVIMSMEQALLRKKYVSLEHIQMVKKAAVAIGRALGLTAGQLEDLSLLAGAYQVGKVSIPDRVLNKRGPLEEREWKLVKKYPEVGYNIAEAIPQISHLSEAILSHHERWDGTGYPQGLSREDIPLYARIIAIADAYAAMVSGRDYRRKLSSSQAVEEIKKNAGTQFDPYVVEKASPALEDCN